MDLEVLSIPTRTTIIDDRSGEGKKKMSSKHWFYFRKPMSIEDQHKFPLYDILVEESKNVSGVDWETIRSTINTMDVVHSELIYAIILHHYFSHQGLTQESIDRLTKCTKGTPQQPYHHRLMNSGKGAMFSLDKVPIDLQNILCAYVDLATR